MKYDMKPCVTISELTRAMKLQYGEDSLPPSKSSHFEGHNWYSWVCVDFSAEAIAQNEEEISWCHSMNLPMHLESALAESLMLHYLADTIPDHTQILVQLDWVD